jgi:hypothetical protein
VTEQPSAVRTGISQRSLPHSFGLPASAGPRAHPSQAGETLLASAQYSLGAASARGTPIVAGIRDGGTVASAALTWMRVGRKAGWEVAGLKRGTALVPEGRGRAPTPPTVGRLSRENMFRGRRVGYAARIRMAKDK